MMNSREIWLAITLIFALVTAFAAFLTPFGWQGLSHDAVIASALVLLAAYAFARRNAQKRPFLALVLWIGVVGGLTLRALIFVTEITPSTSLGLDLFAGQAVLSGFNPYAYSAAEFLGEGMRVGAADLEHARTVIASSPVMAGWLVPASLSDLPIDTPLLALPLLAAAQYLTPDSAWGWFAVLLASDALTFALILILLARMRFDRGWVLLFWVNPIWLGSVYGAGAPVALVAPLVLLALWAGISERSALAGMVLGLAAALNLWIAALLALVLRSAGRRPSAWRRAAYGIVGFGLVLGMVGALHLAFGVPLRWFGALTGTGSLDTATQASALFALETDGVNRALIGGLSRFAEVAWLGLLVAGGLVLALPPLPNQAQRAIRISILGFVAFFLTTQSQPQGLLVLIPLLPLTRSPVLVLAAGFGTLVSLLAGFGFTLANLSPEILARLVVATVLGLMVVAAWLVSVRRKQPLE
ncbi:MAG: hypothetical protein CBC49_009525 [Alphaproteobacteria bacterium TMED89]|nr:hypothetical protein [Rhodospirillaceae bacterium]RPH11423.1 MAG: hypothetical protein CBC49_009525 [Alphaproteobacteria bacterium TMED89]